MENTPLNRIISAFRENKITAYEVAQNSHLTEAGINKILRGDSVSPRKTTIEILAGYLIQNYNYSKEYLFEGINKNNKEEEKLLTEENRSNYAKKSSDSRDINDLIEDLIKYEKDLLKDTRFLAWKRNIELKAENRLLEELRKERVEKLSLDKK